MRWQNETFDPRELRAPERKLDAVSPALCRFFGAIGFTSSSIGALLLGSRWLSLPFDFWNEGNLSGRAIVLLAVSLLLGGLGMFVGWGIAISVPVRSEKSEHVINVLWHYLANGCIIWTFLSILLMTDAVGTARAKEYLQQIGEWRFTCWVSGVSSTGSLATGLLLLLTSQVQLNTRPHWFRAWITALPVALLMGHTQVRALGVTAQSWYLIALVFPFALIAVSSAMIERDREQRRRFLNQ